MSDPQPVPGDAAGGSTTRKQLSPIIAGAAKALMLGGAAGIIADFAGFKIFPPAVSWAAGLAGFLTLSGYDFVKNGAINRMNYFRVLVKYLSIVPLMLAAIVLLSLLSGKMTEGKLPWALACAAFSYLGVLGYSYGSRFHQNLDAVEIGRQLGFSAADSGFLSPDWIYDSKGGLNGVETLFNIEVRAAGGSRYSPLRYRHTLEVLCYCANPQGVKLSVRLSGMELFTYRFLSLFRMLLSVPYMAQPAGWKGSCSFRCTLPETAAGPLSDAGSTGIFTDDYGFKEMWLSGTEFKFVFSKKETPWTALRVKAALEAAAGLAARFC